MRARDVIIGFLWRFALVYGLLILPWPGFDEAYGRCFRTLGQLIFARKNDQHILNFEAVPESLKHVLDTRIALADREELDRNGSGPVRYLELDTRGIGWIPTALFLSLVLATPVPWPRRAWALFAGLVAVHAFILFSVEISLWNNSPGVSLIALNPIWGQIVGGLEETLITQMGVSFVMPVVVWIFVTFRWRDASKWKRC
jgi:hypothetical protein